MIAALLFAQILSSVSSENSSDEVGRFVSMVEPYAKCERKFVDQRKYLAQAWIEAVNEKQVGQDESAKSIALRKQSRELSLQILKECKRNETKSNVSSELKKMNPNLSDDEIDIASEQIVFMSKRLLDTMSAIETGFFSKTEVSAPANFKNGD